MNKSLIHLATTILFVPNDQIPVFSFSNILLEPVKDVKAAVKKKKGAALWDGEREVTLCFTYRIKSRRFSCVSMSVWKWFGNFELYPDSFLFCLFIFSSNFSRDLAFWVGFDSLARPRNLVKHHLEKRSISCDSMHASHRRGIIYTSRPPPLFISVNKKIHITFTRKTSIHCPTLTSFTHLDQISMFLPGKHNT